MSGPGGQRRAVVGGENRARQSFKGVSGDLGPVLGAEDQPNRRVLTLARPMMAGIS